LYYFLFLVYFFAIYYFISKIKFVQAALLNSKTLFCLFSIKIIVGIVGILVSKYLHNGNSDIAFYHKQGLVEYDNLIHHTYTFFTDSLPSAYKNEMNEYFGTSHSFWNDLRNNIILKTIGILNIFSRGNLFINTLFFNAISFLGNIIFFRLFKSIYPQHHLAIIVGCFLLPSTLYFSSVIGKDFIIFGAVSIFCYCMYTSIQATFTTKRIALIVFSFLLITLIRNFIAVILLPVALTWFIQTRFKIKAWKAYASLLGAIFIISIIGQYFPNTYNPLQILVDRQQAFFNLGIANSEYHNVVLKPNIISFLKATPVAIRHAFFSPYLFEFNTIYLTGFFLEMFLYFSLLALSFIYPIRHKNNSFAYFGICFACFILLFTGFITTNANSLIRYRSIYLPFFLIPILCNINWDCLKKR
jgi:hypothetical protein